MKIDWMIMAEGVASDAKGAITAIGIDQTVLVAPEIPTATKRAVLVHLAEDDDHVPTGAKIRFTVSLTSPTGKVISAQTGDVELGAKPFPQLLGAVTLPTEVVIPVREYGPHTIAVVVEQPGLNDQSAEAVLHVVDPGSGDPLGTGKHSEPATE